MLRALEVQLLARGLAPSTAADRARAVFEVIGELTAQLGWTEPDRAAELGRELLEMATAHAERTGAQPMDPIP